MRPRILFAALSCVGVLCLLLSASVGAEDVYVQEARYEASHVGVWFQTDLEVQNVGDTEVGFSVQLLWPNQDNTDSPTVNRSVAPRAVVRLSNLITLFTQGGYGALRIATASDELRVTSRTYAGGWGGASPWENVFFAPGQPATETFASGETAILPQLTRSTGFYWTEVGYVNATASQTVLQTVCYSAAGDLIGQVTDSLQPYAFHGRSDIFADLGADPDDAFCLVHTDTAGGRFLTFAKVSAWGGEPFFIPGQREPVVAEPLYVPSAVHEGDWRTDVEVKAVGTEAASIELALLPSNQDNSVPVTTTIGVSAAGSVRLVDVLQTVFSFSGTAALRVTPSTGNVVVTTRVYNVAASPVASYYVPSHPVSAAFAETQTVTLMQLTRSASGTTTDIGFVNTTGETVGVEMTLFDAGSPTGLSTVTSSVPPFGHVPIPDVLGVDVSDAFALARCTTPACRILAYATVTDNASSNAVHIPARPGYSTSIFSDGFESGETSAWVAAPN